MQTLLIASATKPVDLDAFFAAIREAAVDNSLQVTAGKVVPGPGCANYAFRVEGEDPQIERFSNMVAMALMPAKWEWVSQVLEVNTWVSEL